MSPHISNDRNSSGRSWGNTLHYDKHKLRLTHRWSTHVSTWFHPFPLKLFQQTKTGLASTRRKHQSSNTGKGRRCSLRTPAVVAGRAVDDLGTSQGVPGHGWQLTTRVSGVYTILVFMFEMMSQKFLLDLNNTRFLSCLELESRSNMLRHLTVALPWLQPPRRPLAWNALQPASSETYQRITESQLILGPSPQKKTWPSPLICIILEAAVQFHNGPCSLSADPGRHTSTNIEADTRKCDIGFSHWTLSWYRGAGKSNSWTLE